MAATILMVFSAGIVLLLGAVHLVYTFSGPMLNPRDPSLQTKMRQVSPVISTETTMWKSWICFNASHSIGALLFGLIYGFLALVHAPLLFHSPFLLVVGFAMLSSFTVLARLYWFSVPFACISVSLACYLASIAVSLL